MSNPSNIAAEPSEALDELSRSVLERIDRVLGHHPKPVLLHEPTLAGTHAEQYVAECIRTNWISSAGAYVDRFEQQLSELTGAHAIAMVNGTAALHLALELAEIEKGDEVLVPALTFVASANAVCHAGGTPHFVDVEEATLGIDPERLEEHLQEVGEVTLEGCHNRQTGRPIRALLAVHVFGVPCRIAELRDLAERWNLVLVEDAAESLGASVEGQHTGTFGRVGVISFNGNKLVSTGGGGAILTRDEELARRAKHLSTTAKLPHAWEYEHDAVAYNYRMPNVNAALGCAQLEVLEDLLGRKRQLANAYREAFAGLAGARFFQPTGESRASANHWLNALLLDAADLTERDRLLHSLNAAGYQSRPIWKPLHQLPMYAENPRSGLPVSEELHQRVVNIPSSAHLAARGA